MLKLISCYLLSSFLISAIKMHTSFIQQGSGGEDVGGDEGVSELLKLCRAEE
jgi:hypothetical protein